MTWHDSQRLTLNSISNFWNVRQMFDMWHKNSLSNIARIANAVQVWLSVTNPECHDKEFFENEMKMYDFNSFVEGCENLPNSWEKFIFVRKFCKKTRCSLETLHSWKIFYMTTGRPVATVCTHKNPQRRFPKKLYEEDKCGISFAWSGYHCYNWIIFCQQKMSTLH